MMPLRLGKEAMAQDLFHYEKMVEAALRGVVRDALRRAGREGLRAPTISISALGRGARGWSSPIISAPVTRTR